MSPSLYLRLSGISLRYKEGSYFVSVIFSLVAQVLRTVFAYRDFDALGRKALAERRGLDHTGELLG
jgi:hypothetical protein